MKNQPKGTNSTPRAHTPTGEYPTRGGPGAASPRENALRAQYIILLKKLRIFPLAARFPGGLAAPGPPRVGVCARGVLLVPFWSIF